MAILNVKNKLTGDLSDTHPSCEYADVNYYVNTVANNGDTVQLPVGEAHWASTLTFAKDISILGAGVDITTVIPRNTVATIIHAEQTAGGCINATFQNNPTANWKQECRISGLVIEQHKVGASYLINLSGRCYRRRDVSNNIVGGLRVDNMRYRNTADTGSGGTNIGANGKLVVWGGPASGSGIGTFITGSYDHNFTDYIAGTSGSETCSFGCTGSPLTSTGQAIVPNGFGQYQWEQDYTYGGGDDTELNVLYIEDNIFHRFGFNLGTLAGGVRIIARYNTSWGGISGHGIDSGGNFGAVSWETYNNYFDHTNSPSTAASIGTRGGAHVIFNNRFTKTPNDIASQTYRPFSNKSDCIGPATGRNFLDENYSGTLLFNGDTFPKVVTAVDNSSDPRIGDCYAKGGVGTVTIPTGGTVGRNYTLSTLDGTRNWAGFTIVNTTIGGDGSDGDQGAHGVSNGQYSGYISSNTGTTINVIGGGNQDFNLTTSHAWEIRRVKTYFCNPGSGKLPKQSSGGTNNGDTTNGDQTGFYYLSSDPSLTGVAAGKHKYWAGVIPFGIWQAYNLTRANSGVAWSTPGLTTTITGGNSAITVPGGFNNGSLPTHKKNDGTGTAYPTRSNTADNLRIGAHWQAPGIDPRTGSAYAEGIDSSAGVNNGAASNAYGGAWPNAMISGTVLAAPVITSALTASGTINTPFTYTIVASNNPTTYGATGLPSMIGINVATGVISGTNDGQPATYSVTITAANAGGSDTKTLVITMSGLGSGKRGKGTARRIGAGARRF